MTYSESAKGQRIGRERIAAEGHCHGLDGDAFADWWRDDVSELPCATCGATLPNHDDDAEGHAYCTDAYGVLLTLGY